jgi:hypothetical protein
MEATQNANSNFKNRENRRRINGNVINFRRAAEALNSERAAATITGIPRSTAQYHARRRQQCDLDDTVLEFFQSDSGLSFLNQLVLAIEFVLSEVGHCGLRLIQRLYELSGLDRLVACSLGALSQRNKHMESHLIAYGRQQETRLVATMPADKAITCCMDETFPSGICLVGIEPVANFILLEEMAANRNATTWADAMDKRLAHFPVTIIQVTSDEAKALIHYTEQHVGAHHSPDLFHVQQEVSKASAAPLRSKVKKAVAAADKIALALEALKNQQVAYEEQERKPVGRPIDYARRQTEAEVVHATAIQEVEQAQCRQETVRKANKALGDSYHPFDMETGKERTPESLRIELYQTFDLMQGAVKEAGLSDNSLKRIEKARRTINAMVATLQFFWLMVQGRLKSLALDGTLEKVVVSVLLPAAYSELHATKAKTADLRKQRLATAARLYEQLEQDKHWQSLPRNRQDELKKVAVACVQIFQRSSSNVEGRNGQLSLHHHIYKNMSTRKLAASTVIHNYFIQRQDGTTAAERFFGKAPESLFRYLLSVTDYPASPAKSRSVVRKLNKAA